MTTEATCQHCGKSFSRPARGRLPRYCCNAHRQAAWQAKRRPTMGRERHQVTEAAPVAWAELEALAAQVVALAGRVEALEAAGRLEAGYSSAPVPLTNTDDRPAAILAEHGEDESG